MTETTPPRADAQTIVVAVDGSNGSDHALQWAIAEAEATRRRILLVCAVPFSQSLVSAALSPLGFDDANSSGRDVLRRGQRRCRQAGVAVGTSLVEGSPAEVLVDTARDAAMLVLGARGHGEVASLVLGSVSEACAHRAACPVVIIRPGVASGKEPTTQPVATSA